MLTTAMKRPGDRVRPAKTTRKKVPGGRPPKSDKGTADVNIIFRVRKEDREAFKEAAEAEGKTLTDWILERLRPAAKPSSKKRRPQG
jgi:hypothetical protein